MTANDETLRPRDVPARSIPVPRHVSPPLQQAIAAAAAVNHDARLRVPQTAEQWRAMAAASNALTMQRIAAIRARFPCELEAREIDGVVVREITPAVVAPENRDRLLVHLHGGAYVISGGEASVAEGMLMAHYARTRVLSVDYRMPPDHPFPAAVDDAVSVWRALVRDFEDAPHQPYCRRLAAFGASAGGGLVLAMVMKLKELRLPLPAAIAPGTPWSDLAGHSDSYHVNAHIDSVLPFYPGTLEACAKVYAGATGLDHPLVSPVHGDFSRFPPTLLTTGTRDILLSDTVRVHRKLKQAGVASQLEVYEGLSHAEYAYAIDSDESREVFTEIARFFDRHLD